MLKTSSKPNFKDALVDAGGFLTRSWFQFFGLIVEILRYLGQERVFSLANNVSGQNVTGLVFDKRYTSQAYVFYLIQRILDGSSFVQGGMLICNYNPDSDLWNVLEGSNTGPNNAGVTFSITAAGQVQYDATNEVDDIILFRMVYRVHELAGKAYYSAVG